MLRANYHTHTKFCDGDNTAEEMVQRALDLGFEHLGFSGHMDPDIHMDWPSYVVEIDRLKKKYAAQPSTTPHPALAPSTSSAPRTSCPWRRPSP